MVTLPVVGIITMLLPVAIVPFVRLSIPLTVVLLFNVIPPASEIVKLLNVVLLVPPIVWPLAPLNVVVLVAVVNAPLFVQSPAILMVGEPEHV